jgi:hypothetical protein
MKLTLAAAVFLASAATAAVAQKPSSEFDRGHGQQAWQNSGFAAVTAKCKTPPKPFSIGGGASAAGNTAAPPPPALPTPNAIPGVIAAGQTWKVVWAWEGNNADGPIADANGSILFANNDAGNVMRLDPSTGLATVVFDKINTAGAVSRSKNGALFVVARGLGGGVLARADFQRPVVGGRAVGANELEGIDDLRRAVLGELEIIARQRGRGLALVRRDGHVHTDDVGAGAKDRALLLRILDCGRGRRDDPDPDCDGERAQRERCHPTPKDGSGPKVTILTLSPVPRHPNPATACRRS